MAHIARFVTLLISFAAAGFFAAAPSFAESVKAFDAKAFQTAQAQGKAVLIEVHADWCPTCKAQAPVLDKLSNEKNFSRIARYRVDFDTQKPLLKTLKVSQQSTLILYVGKKEVARSVGVTSEASIRAMLDMAI